MPGPLSLFQKMKLQSGRYDSKLRKELAKINVIVANFELYDSESEIFLAYTPVF